MRAIKITTIMENTCTLGDGLLAEHGLSLLVQSGDHSVLLDTGASSAAVSNAKILGIDLKAVDSIVLSHGHNDHTGGLGAMLEATGPKKVYAHPGVFDRKFSVRPNLKPRANGIRFSQDQLVSLGADLRLSEAPVRLDGGIIFTAEIPRTHAIEMPSQEFRRAASAVALDAPIDPAQLEWDSMSDDASLIIEGDEGFVLVSGCAHSGVVNTILYAQELVKKPLRAFVGGTHLKGADAKRTDWTIDFLKNSTADIIAANHCTGFLASAQMLKNLGDRFVLNNVGSVIEMQV